MGGRLAKGVNAISDHYVLFLLVLTLMGLTIMGVGNTATVSMLGFVLCAAGLFQKPGRVDTQILYPMLAYLVIGAASSYAVLGNVSGSYTAVHTIFPVVYLLLACLQEQELLWLRWASALWAGYVAALGMVQFIQKAMSGSVGRLYGIMGNPNSMGIFLAAGWFGLTAWMPEDNSRFAALLRRLEPLLLMGMALPLSMGSFLALAAGMAVRAAGWVRESGWREAAQRSSRMLAKAALCVGSGLVMYFIGRYSGMPVLCVGLILWLAALMVLWDKIERFLLTCRWFPWALCACGVAVALAAALGRPSAPGNFMERLEMMRNGVGYLTEDPLLGVGPYQWRILNLADSDRYFETWYIHNVPLHIGVELGWLALAAVLMIALRTLWKKGRNLAGFVAFLLHNLIDPSFFYLGVTTMVLFTSGEPEKGGRQLNAFAVRAAFAVFALLFLFYYLTFTPAQT